MYFDSSMRYATQQFINKILELYGYFSRQAILNYTNIYGSIFSVNDEVFEIHSGSSKVCLVFYNNSETVIKIPLVHSINNKTDRKYRNKYIKSIHNASYPNFTENYDLCKIEVNNYEAAKKYGIARFFAEEKKVMIYHGIPVYIQKRVKECYSESDRSDEVIDATVLEEIESLSNILKDTSGIDQLWEYETFLEDLYNYAGKDFDAVFNFIAEKKINDLHDENIGYDYNNTPIFFDYSGFH